MRRKTAIFLIVFFLGIPQNACGKKQDVIYLETVEKTEKEVQTECLAEPKRQEPSDCFVYVCGAVKNPGVYQMKEGSRVYEAIAMAGGLTEEAQADAVNQAQMISDGQMLRILTAEEAQEAQTEETQTVEDGRVNVNLAAVEELMNLPGIGKAKAESIVQYREQHGGFSNTEEIMNVEGIKEGVYNRIKENIKVK